jgi:hypothetical protein
MSDDQLVADYLQRLRAVGGALPADRRDELVEEITAHIAEARTSGPDAGLGSAADVRNILERLGPPEDIVRAAQAAPQAPGYGTADTGFDAGAGQPPAGFETSGTRPGTGYGADSYPEREDLSTPGGVALAGPAAGRDTGAGPLEITAVILLLIGGFLAGVGWVAGVILLWMSPRWRTSDKVLGTLVWPGGLLAAGLVLLAAGGIGVFATSTSCSQSSVTAMARGLAAAVSVNGQTGQVSVNGTGGQVFVSTPGEHVSRRVTAKVTCTTAGPATSWLILVLAIIFLLGAVVGPVLVAIRLLRRAGRLPASAPPDPARLQRV